MGSSVYLPFFLPFMIGVDSVLISCDMIWLDYHNHLYKYSLKFLGCFSLCSCFKFELKKINIFSKGKNQH
jgi:hypothetical protein